MSESVQNRFSKEPGISEAEKTLRLIASLPSPAGLEDRVQAGLKAAPRGGRILAWPALTVASGWLRSAAAAAIVFVVAGGGWSIYSRVQPSQPLQGSSGPGIASPYPGSGKFSTGEAVRRPQTLNGPTVTQPVTPKKPQAKVLAKAQAKGAPMPGAKFTVSKAASPTVAAQAIAEPK